MKTLIQSISMKLGAIANCKASNNQEWLDKHSESLDEICKKQLPKGSGLDCGVDLLIEESNEKKIVFSFDFHHLNEDGFYDGWTSHKLIVTPSFNGFDMRITGKDKNQLKDYLYDLFGDVLSAEIQ